MALLRVRGAELNATAGRLDNSSERMKQASGELRAAGTAGLGSAELDSACAEFADSWHYGTNRLSELAGHAAGFVRKAVETYADADRKLSQALHQEGTG